MKLFRATSEMLKEWQSGDIIVMAANVEMARREVLTFYREQHEETLARYADDSFRIEIEVDEYEDNLEILLKDLDGLKEVTSNVVMLYGSA